jgi:hypothetical protein
MKIEALRQYAKLRQQLFDEKNELETRLREINEVLGAETAPPAAAPIPAAPVRRARPAARPRQGPRGGNTMSMREAVMKVLAQGPRRRGELVQAIQDLGYVFTTKNPLNSLGSVLYAKNTPLKNKGGLFYLPGNLRVETADSRAPSTPAGREGEFKRSAEARARMSAAQKARWAKARGER